MVRNIVGILFLFKVSGYKELRAGRYPRYRIDGCTPVTDHESRDYSKGLYVHVCSPCRRNLFNQLCQPRYL
jgi:uncharacterized Fe-S cluster-containing protein